MEKSRYLKSSFVKGVMRINLFHDAFREIKKDYHLD